MAHIFFEKLENRRSTQSLFPATPYYPAPYPYAGGYNWNSYKPNYPASSASWLNFSVPSYQSSPWNPMGSSSWIQGWNQPWSQGLYQPGQWSQGWYPSQSSTMMSNIIQAWNNGWTVPFPQQSNQSQGLFGLWQTPYEPYQQLYTYGVGFPMEISTSGILF